MRFLWVGVGGAIGSVARYWLSVTVMEMAGGTFPWGTLLVNIIGCSFIGWFGAFTGPGTRLAAGHPLRLFVMSGICGGFTTFSSFSYEALGLARNGEWLKASAYVVASVIACLVGVWLGYSGGSGWQSR
jgi:CrcB protein